MWREEGERARSVHASAKVPLGCGGRQEEREVEPGEEGAASQSSLAEEEGGGLEQQRASCGVMMMTMMANRGSS